MKSRLVFRISLSILLLALAVLIACGQEQDEVPSSQAIPTSPPPESARPLTAHERTAIDAFDQQLQGIDEKWGQFYQELDSWRSGLVECHPTAAPGRSQSIRSVLHPSRRRRQKAAQDRNDEGAGGPADSGR